MEYTFKNSGEIYNTLFIEKILIDLWVIIDQEQFGFLMEVAFKPPVTVLFVSDHLPVLPVSQCVAQP